jgi:hypothetical protein
MKVLKAKRFLKAFPIWDFFVGIFSSFGFGISLGIWFLVFGISPLGAVPVYTDTTYPIISVVDTAEYYKVTISDVENDSLDSISYAWGAKPNIYTAVCVGVRPINWTLNPEILG